MSYTPGGCDFVEVNFRWKRSANANVKVTAVLPFFLHGAFLWKPSWTYQKSRDYRHLAEKGEKKIVDMKHDFSSRTSPRINLTPTALRPAYINDCITCAIATRGPFLFFLASLEGRGNPPPSCCCSPRLFLPRWTPPSAVAVWKLARKSRVHVFSVCGCVDHVFVYNPPG